MLARCCRRVVESVVENAVVGGGEWCCGGQDLLEGARVSAGYGACQRAWAWAMSLCVVAAGRSAWACSREAAGGFAHAGQGLFKLGGAGQGFSLAQPGAG